MGGHQRPLFVLFGASMTQFSFELGGWGAALTDLYSRKADVLLRGYSGWNTRRALAVLEDVFPKESPRQPALVIVFFGANDAAVPVPSGRGQHVPIEEFKNNLKRIAAYLKGLSDSTQVVLITTPPIYEKARQEFASSRFGEPAAAEFLDRTNGRAGDYAAACKSAADDMGVAVVDLWTAVQQQPDWQTHCLTDGMHLGPEGSKILLTELLQVLKKGFDGLPSLHWQFMDVDFPQPSEYDYVHPYQELALTVNNSI